jgi:copper transport protein
VRKLAGLLVALSVAGAAPSAAAPASARAWHTQLESSDPAAGDTVAFAPQQLTLTFGGFVEESGAVFRLIGPSGRSWELEGRRVPDTSRALSSPLPVLDPGGYRLEWRVISGDGHPISGDFVFFVSGPGEGERSLGRPPPRSAANGAAAGDGRMDHRGEQQHGSRWLMATRAGADAALLLLAGLLFFEAWAAHAPSRWTGVTTSVLAAIAPVLIATYAWLWAGSVLGAVHTRDVRLDALASLFTGRALTAELAFAGLTAWALLLARRPGVASATAALAILAGSFAGHPASYTPLLSIPASAVHQLAAAAWVGGLLFLLTEARSPTFDRSAQRVSAVAFAAAVLVALTGLVQSWILVDSPSQVLSSTFGLLLLAKFAGLLGLLAFGAHHRFRLLPSVESPLGAAQLRRSVRAELALAVGVVTLAAVLSHIPPNP